MRQYQIVVHFGYDSTMRYFDNKCIYIRLNENCLNFPEWHICNLNVSISSRDSIFYKENVRKNVNFVTIMIRVLPQ